LIRNQDADELEWYVPSGIAISELERIQRVIKQFLEVPIDLEGKKASQLLSKKRRRRRRRSPSPASDDEAVLSGDEPRRKKKEKKKKEKEQYKSAQFIEDIDEEYGNMDVFLEKEKAQREKTSLAAAASAGSRPPTMKATGTKFTKKRRKKADRKKPPKSKKTKEDERSPTSGDSDHRANDMLNQMEMMRKSLSVLRQLLRPDLDRDQDHLLSGAHRPLHCSSSLVPSSPVPSDSAKPSQRRSKRLILSDDDE
jgi:replication fork protection complex subunit Tof1/Swi1